MEFKRVVVTGMGTINPLGKNIDEYWENLKNGVSGAAPITRFDASNYKTQFACEVKDYKPTDYFDRKDARKYDLYTQFALIASNQALKNSKLDVEAVNKDRVGVILGVGIGGLETFYNEARSLKEEAPKFSPFFIPKMIANIAGGLLAIEHGFRGPNFTTVTACASATHAIIEGLTQIRLGKADVIVTGGSEAAINEAGVCGFNSMRAISTRNDDPKTASRPFDKDRDGFVMGEGSGALILEEYEHAVKRGATIYAELVGGGMNCDAYHMTAPHPDGEGAAAVMRQAIEDAGLQIEDVDYVNVHGTSTGLGDIAEPKALARLFGEHVYNLSISSTKSMTGHLLGAAGAVEAIASILALNNGVVPPTINQFELDPDVDEKLDFTFNKAKERDIKVALSNTFGFGGHNGTVLFKKLDN
ncbi:beta-ketoacyl-[acyl-carrier-protein] synthase II [Prolixibacteraceae bacterium JC049]|nr:beta-ketoacyl-[acyl-carrier-protein] synthase II [Prolixibacteraceae bacterium JC049]